MLEKMTKEKKKKKRNDDGNDKQPITIDHQLHHSILLPQQQKAKRVEKKE